MSPSVAATSNPSTSSGWVYSLEYVHMSVLIGTSSGVFACLPDSSMSYPLVPNGKRGDGERMPVRGFDVATDAGPKRPIDQGAPQRRGASVIGSGLWKTASTL